MFLAILDFLLWLQPAATPAASSGGSGGGGGGMNWGMNLLMMGGILAVTYFFLLRPDQQRRKENEDMLKGLRRGMKVRTTGGILGEIVSLTDREVVIAVADKVRLNVLRENIRGAEAEAPVAATAAAEPSPAKDK